jgi:hypothetical protein
VHMHVLQGHKLAGVSRGYIQRMMMESGQGLRRSQRMMSRRMLELMKV